MKNNDPTLDRTDKSGKYLTFSLNTEEYGIDILRLKEIIGITAITPIPKTPGYVKGVINLREKVIPIIDLRLKFEMPQEAYTERTCIIVIEARTDSETSEQQNQKDIGVVVDHVSEVIHIKQDDIEPAPSFGGGNVKTEYILGMAKVEGGVKILLDIHHVLSDWDQVVTQAA